MNNKKIEEKIFSAVDEMTPKHSFESISEKIVPVAVKERTKVMKINFKRYAFIAVAACLVLALGLSGGAYYGNFLAVDSVIDIDVNPSIELKTNKQDRVLSAQAINDDALLILDGMDLKNVDLNVAVNAIIGSMVKQGFVFDKDNGILVTVQNGSAQKAEAIKNIVVENINVTLKENDMQTSVLNQTLDVNADVEEFAKQNNVSAGKAQLAIAVAGKVENITAEDVADMGIKEIKEIVKASGIDLSGIVEIDDEDGPIPSDIIKLEEAKKVALHKANCTEADVLFWNMTELSNDDGRVTYEFEFKTSQYEFEITVDAYTGNILEAECDEITVIPTAMPTYAPTASPSATPSTTPTEYIGEEHAQKIAMSISPMSTMPKILSTELKKDDGRWIYEVEFVQGNVEFDVEIDAYTGEVLWVDKEKVAVVTPATHTPIITPGIVVTPTPRVVETPDADEEKVKDLALAYANVLKSEVTHWEKVELDVDDGKKVYEVEFKVQNTEFDVVIDAESYKVLEFNKDIDD